MDFIDYYQVLGLDSSASSGDMKMAYRKLARKYHPDLNPTDESAKRKFQEINEANEVFSDPEKRAKCDTCGRDWKHSDTFEQQRHGRGSYRSGDDTFDQKTDFYDTFEIERQRFSFIQKGWIFRRSIFDVLCQNT